jgi:predicted transcriptional regulator
MNIKIEKKGKGKGKEVKVPLTTHPLPQIFAEIL